MEISRRSLIKAGGGTLAAGALMAPRPLFAVETTPVEATVRSGAVPFIMGDSLGGVSVTPYGSYEGGLVRMAVLDDRARGIMNRIQLVSQGANYGVRANWIPQRSIDLSQAQTIEFWAYLESPRGWPNGDSTSGAPGWITFGDRSFANSFNAFFTLRNGWNHIRLSRSMFNVVDGAPNWNTPFELMRIAMLPASTGPISAYFGDFRRSGADRPLLCLMFDDGEDSVRINALPIIRNYGTPITCAIISNKMGRTEGTRTFSSMSRLLEYPTGTVFINHTANHYRGVLDQPSTSYQTILSEISTCKNALRNLPGFDPTLFAAPYGEWSDLYLQVQRDCGITAARSIISGSSPGYKAFTGARLDNPYLMRAWSITKDHTPSQVLGYVDTGIASGQSMILLFHDIRPTAVNAIDYPTAWFQSIMDGLQTRRTQLDTVTLPKMVQRLGLNGTV